MNIICADNIHVAVIDKHQSIKDSREILDTMASARYNHDCDALIVYRESLDDTFFDLKTGIAGEMLQKFSNYGMKIAIVGEFGQYKSKSLRGFIYECNKGNCVFFKSSVEEALKAFLKLSVLPALCRQPESFKKALHL